MSDRIDPTKTTFSQAQGYEALPQPLKLGQVGKNARLMLWNHLYIHAFQHESSYASVAGQWKAILMTLHVYFFLLPVDDFDRRIRTLIPIYKPAILTDLPFDKIFDMLQMIMRHRECPKRFVDDIARAFRSCRLAYVVDTQKPVTILPAASEQEGQSLLASMAQLRDDGLVAAVTHLRQGSECISESDWTGAIRESIHAVESVRSQA